MSVAERLNQLNLKIHEACERAGRDRSSVRLLAVSKLHSANLILKAVAWGQLEFAENYVQEALVKQAELHDAKLSWHFIGRIQSNKVKALAAADFNAIHSVDRIEVLEALNKACSRRQDIFLQYNVAAEATKGGAGSETELEDLLTAAKNCANLRVLGLMVMPPLESSADESRAHFRKAREILSKLRGKFGGEEHPLNELSMGTSSDFAEAIAEGATIIRIGTEIFGPREPKGKSQ